MPYSIDIGVRDRGGATARHPKFWKTMEIRANARKNQENSGRHQPRSPMLIDGFRSLARRRKGNSLI
jgi:hypothetical protein